MENQIKNKKQTPGGVLREGVPKNFGKFTVKHLRWSIFLKTFQAWGLHLH